MMAEMTAQMDKNQLEMRSTVCAMQYNLDETIACNEVMETEPDPGMM
jgi:hypothetical protein